MAVSLTPALSQRARGRWSALRAIFIVMAVASYHLWLHWRAPGLHLARLFTDYEPGILWSQAQMQSGTTGINRLRIYNPVKQPEDRDPDGQFIRRWVLELAQVPAQAIDTPWRLSAAEQAALGVRIGRDYPAPIVDHEVAAREARRRLGAIRRQPQAKAEGRAISKAHGSRRRGWARRLGAAPGARVTGTPCDGPQEA